MNKQPVLNFVQRDQMSLVGLMLGRIIEANLATPRGAAQASKLKGKLGVTAGKMSLTVDFKGDTVTITSGLDTGLRARVRGSLSGLLGVSLGHSLVKSFFAGQVSVSGNPFFAIRVLPLIAANPSRKERSI